MVTEGLVGLVREASRIGLLEGIFVGYKGVEMKLLQFADDTVFFCQPKLKCILAIKVILRSFEIASGLKVNFHKSKIGAVGISDMDMNIFSNSLNCGSMTLPFVYLGIRIGGNQRKMDFWNPIIHKIQSRLSMWKGILLSMAGRICLIKSVISALSLFYLSFFKAPELVCKAIKSVQIRFLWGWGTEGRKIPWVTWDKVCLPIEMRGLGVRDIFIFNSALIAK